MQPLSARPRAPSRPCPACGKAVDPLRAREVVALEDGFRYLCGVECRDAWRSGERAHELRTPLPEGIAVRAPLIAPPRSRPPRGGRTHSGSFPRRVLAPVAPAPVPWIGLSASVVALVLAVLPYSLAIALAAAGATIGAAVATIAYTWHARAKIGLLAFATAPSGAVLAALAGLAHHVEDPAAWLAQASAAVAAGAVVARAWLDARGQRPIEAAIRELIDPIPTAVRVPVRDAADPFSVASAEVPAARVRTGEEVIVLEGDVVAVDGVVQAGEAWALLHPGAATAVRRRQGEPLLAGARIVEGEVRLLVTRVGDDRALVRPARFGDGRGPSAAPIARLAGSFTQWGGAIAVAGAAAAVVIATGEDFGSYLAAAAAVLLGAPLLAIRRGAEDPQIAAAAAAGARGIVFQNARALDRAGRVAVAAVGTRGTLTEGQPQVVEVTPVDGGSVEPLIALAAAAETVADPHPIARAILRHAEARRLVPESVRRATFHKGRGVTAIGPGGEAIVLGSRQLLLDEGVSVAVADAEAARSEARGHTVVFMGVGGRVRAVLALEDDMRPGARAAVQRLFDLGMEVVLLSGDHRGTVEAIARTVDVALVKAELLPEERGGEIARLQETGNVVAAIGHPAQDDAALAAADVPVVLGAAGGPAGERAIALATEDIRDASAALWIARAAREGAWRTVLVSLGAGATILALAAAGLALPAITALWALGVDAYALPAGVRLLSRIDRRVPARG